MSSPPPSSGRGLAAALQVLPDPVAIFDVDWTICHLNLAGALLDRPAAELIGRNIWGRAPRPRRHRLPPPSLRARSEGAP